MKQKKRLFIDLLIVITITIGGTIAMAIFDIYEKIHDFTRKHERFELDEIGLGAFLLAFCLYWFAVRRYKDSLMESKRSNQLEIEKNRAVTEKSESLEIMAGSIAHNFNNQLAVVSGNLELAQYYIPKDSPGRKNIEDALVATGKAIEVSQLMLTYVGQGKMELKNLNSGLLLEDMAASLSEGIPETISLQFNVTESILEIHGDYARIGYVLKALVNNAVDSIGEDSGTITLSNGVMNYNHPHNRQSSQDYNIPEGEYIFLEVNDTGCGMSNELKTRIFDPFFTTKFTGRGLGLPSAMGIARMHKGTILVESQPGVGTTVRCLFPIKNKERR